MIAYVDSSVALRALLRQPNALADWRSIRTGVASALVEVECLRTLDRLRLRFGVPDPEIAVRRAAVYRLMETLEVVAVDRAVLERAAPPAPTLIGALDAIHLATALLWRERTGRDLVMATHDAELARAARASGLHVIGV